MSVVSMKQLLEAGVHFGHQTRRWNPKMATYIYTERNGIYIIDLQKTVKKLEEAYNLSSVTWRPDGESHAVRRHQEAGTGRHHVKRQSASAMFYVNARWLGGMLTNFKTMRTRIDRLAQLRKMEEDGTFAMLPKKEVIKHQGEIAKLEKYLGGVKDMKKLPGALFIVDPRKERNAIAEARKLHIPIVAIVDTNCDPDEIDYVIPGNDDAIRAIRLIAATMANAVVEGRQGEDASVEQRSSPRRRGSRCRHRARQNKFYRFYNRAPAPAGGRFRKRNTGGEQYMAFTATDVKKLARDDQCRHDGLQKGPELLPTVIWIRPLNGCVKRAWPSCCQEGEPHCGRRHGLAPLSRTASALSSKSTRRRTSASKAPVFVDFVKDIAKVVAE